MTDPNRQDELSLVRRELERLREEPLDDDFGRRLHLRLAAAAPPEPPSLMARVRELCHEHPTWFGALLGGGVTAAAAAVLVVGLLGPRPEGSRLANVSDGAPPPAASAETGAVYTAPEEHTVPSGRVALVQFHIGSRVDVPEARIRVELPAGLTFYDRDPDERAFVLVTELARGETPIPIAVEALRPGRHVVEAIAVIEGVEVHHQVVLHVEEEAG